MPTVLITEASRGPGLELAATYAARGWEVIAVNRTPLAPMDLVGLGPGVRELRYTPSDDTSLANVAARLAGHAIDVVILGPGADPDTSPAPEALTPDHWESTLLAATWTPFHLTALLEPNLRAGTTRTIAAIARAAGTPSPARFTERAAGAALNQLLRNLSIEWRDWGAIVLMLSPGEAGPDRAAALARAIDTATPADSGLHRDTEGKIVPW